MKLKFDLKMLVEVKDLEIYGDNIEDCIENLHMLLAEEIVNLGVVENSQIIDYSYDEENELDIEFE